MRRLIIGAAAVAALGAGAWGLWRAGAAAALEAMDAQVAVLAEQGVLVRWEARRVGGFPLAYEVALEGVSVGAADGAWAFRAPWSSSRAPLLGGDAIVTTLAETGRLDVAGAGGPVAFDVRSDELSLRAPLTRGPAEATARRLSLAQTGSEDGDGIEAEGLSARLEADAGAASLDVATLTVRAAGGAAAIDGLTLRASAGGAPLTEPGARRELAFAAAGLRSAGTDGFDAAAGPMSLTVSDDGARARYAGRAQAIRAAPAGGPLTVGLATLTLEVPSLAGAAAEGFTLTAAAEEVAPSDALWAALDPDATLERAPGAATLAIDGRARAPRAPGLGRPVTVETVRIEEFRAEGLGAEIAATGELALREGGGVPSGEVSLAAAGWAPALAALERAGIAQPAQAALLRGLAERLNAPDAPPGAFFSEIVLRGGMVFANGVRVR